MTILKKIVGWGVFLILAIVYSHLAAACMLKVVTNQALITSYDLFFALGVKGEPTYEVHADPYLSRPDVTNLGGWMMVDIMLATCENAARHAVKAKILSDLLISNCAKT